MEKQGVTVKGCFRVHLLDPDGKLVGDSGWRKNQITNLGFNQYIVMSLGSIAGSKYITDVALGSGTAPGATDTTLDKELTDSANRHTVTAASSSGSKTLRFTATFASADSFITGAAKSISNIGLFNTHAATTGTLFGGNTFNSSSCASNQAVNITYDLLFATA